MLAIPGATISDLVLVDGVSPDFSLAGFARAYDFACDAK
jgi:hypothetical protein